MQKIALLTVTALLCLPAVADSGGNSGNAYQQCRFILHDNLELTTLALMAYSGACRNAPTLLALSPQSENAEQRLNNALRRLEKSGQQCEKRLQKLKSFKYLQEELEQKAKREQQAVAAQMPADEAEREKYMTAYCVKKAKTVFGILERYGEGESIP